MFSGPIVPATIKNKLPPFHRLVSVIISANSEITSLRGAQEIKKKLLNIDGMEIMGPISSPIFKIKKQYRTRLLARSKPEILIQKKLGLILKNLKRADYSLTNKGHYGLSFDTYITSLLQ